MQKEIKTVILERLDFNEKRIRDCMKEIRNCEKENESIRLNIISYKEGFDAHKLLTDEKHRVFTAISMTKNNNNAAKLLNISIRTLQRKLKNYNIKAKNCKL